MMRYRTFTLTLRVAPDRDAIRSLRGFLKVAWRHFGMRCTHAREKSSNTVQQQEIPMDANDLARLRAYATTSRSSTGFGGATYLSFDWKEGRWLAGKNKVDLTGDQLVADLGDVMGGFQRLEKGRRPQYALTQILDPSVNPIERSELSDYVENRADDDKDPWVPVTASGFFDLETRANYVVIAAYAARDAMSNLLEAFVNHATTHPEAADQLPLVTFGVRAFPKNDSEHGYAAQFDIESWVDRPAAVMHIKPPPVTITAEAAKGNGTSGKKVSQVKPKRKIRAEGEAADMDEEVSF